MVTTVLGRFEIIIITTCYDTVDAHIIISLTGLWLPISFQS